MNRVTAQDFYDYTKCPHRVYLNRFGDLREKLPQADFLNLLFESALLHEQECIKSLPYRSPEGDTPEGQAMSTLRLMEEGAERIYQGVLIAGNGSGRPDILEKSGGHSRFGDYLYKPVDIKSGSGYEEREDRTLRVDYGMQLLHYAKLLQEIQGIFPSEGQILNKKAERVVYPLDDFVALYGQVHPEIANLVNGAKTDEPVRCQSCTLCQWWGHCEPILVKGKDVSLLPEIGRARRSELIKVGVKSIPDVMSIDFRKVKLKGIGPKISESLTRHAEVSLSGTMKVLQKPTLRDARFKVYFDFEDDPTQELIYLCGLLFEPDWNGRAYCGLVGPDEQGEGRMWADFQEICSAIQSEDFIVLHYSAYEKTKMSQLEAKYGASKKQAVEHFRAQMVDLFPLVRQTAVLPTRGYGLKHVAPLLGFKYSAKDAGGAQSIVWFQEYQKDPANAEILDKILTYNKDDCVAMKVVYDWLRSL
ncbi:MAG: TM0106 family RecB-like putative nuclease [Terriglobia bacterium]|jgi:uncharacterized protein